MPSRESYQEHTNTPKAYEPVKAVAVIAHTGWVETGAASRDSNIDSFATILRHLRKKYQKTQLWLAQEINKDHSWVCRVERGDLIPKEAQVKLISNSLSLKSDEREKLQLAYERDVRASESSVEKRFSVEELVFRASENLKLVRRLRLEGKPQLAAEMAHLDASWMRGLIVREPREATKIALQTSLAHLLMEQNKSYMDYVLQENAWNYSKTIIQEQHRLARVVGNDDLKRLVLLSYEATNYVAGNYVEAQRVCQKLMMNCDTDFEPRWYGELLRATAINSGNLRDSDVLRDVAKDIKKHATVLGESAPETLSLWEGLARGEGENHKHSAMASIERAWNALEAGKRSGIPSGLREVQLIRTQLKVMSALKVRDNEFEKLGEKGILLSEFLGNIRYTREIRGLVDLRLNQERKRTQK